MRCRDALTGLASLAAIFATPAAAELNVVVTIKPVHALVARVMAGIGTPAVLVKGSASPHTFALKPSDAKALNQASVFFRVSEGIEPFTAKVVNSLPKSVRVVTLAEAPGIEPLVKRFGGTFEAHSHGHDDHHYDQGEPHNRHQSHPSRKDREEPGTRDGHIWLDPENAKKMVTEIARVLSEISPRDSAKLNQNAANVIKDLDVLQTELAHDLEPVRGKPFIVFHDAYQYFERRFGLDAAGSVTVSPEVQPGAKRLAELRRKIAELGVVCVFAEPQFQPKTVAAIIEGTNAKSGTLDPEGASVEPGPDAYVQLLRNLAGSLKGCLVQGS